MSSTTNIACFRCSASLQGEAGDTRGIWNTNSGCVYLRLRSRKEKRKEKREQGRQLNHGDSILRARRWQRWGNASGGAADAAAIRNAAQCPPEQERPPSVAKSWVVRISKIYALERLVLPRDIHISQILAMSDLSDEMWEENTEKEKKKRENNWQSTCHVLETADNSTLRLVAKWLLIIDQLSYVSTRLIINVLTA